MSKQRIEALLGRSLNDRQYSRRYALNRQAPFRGRLGMMEPEVVEDDSSPKSGTGNSRKRSPKSESST